MTPKQQRFVDEYLIDLNATQAAIRAGYSEKTAQEQGSRLLSNVMVQKAVTEGQAEHADNCAVTVESLIAELAEAIKLAKDVSQPAAITGAVLAKAKILGLVVDKFKGEVTVSPLAEMLARIDGKTKTID